VTRTPVRHALGMAAYTVRLNDIDAAGVVFAARICAIAHECYEDDLAAAGLPLARLLAEGSCLLPLVRLEADFRAPLRHGDRLTTRYAVECGTDRYHVTIELRLDDDRVAGRVIQHHRCLSAARQACSLPPAVRDALTRLPAG
jgi:1,4-dihydroxy-2-naphthoyl-CoA hydrolase